MTSAKAQDEIGILWRGELLLEALLTWPDRPPHAEDTQILWDLHAELKRIRHMRVQRQEARKRARRKRAQAR